MASEDLTLSFAGVAVRALTLWKIVKASLAVAYENQYLHLPFESSTEDFLLEGASLPIHYLVVL